MQLEALAQGMNMQQIIMELGIFCYMFSCKYPDRYICKTYKHIHVHGLFDKMCKNNLNSQTPTIAR